MGPTAQSASVDLEWSYITCTFHKVLDDTEFDTDADAGAKAAAALR